MTYRGLLSLFSNDSMIYEPFSKSKCLVGKSEIEPFLRTVIMANKGMQYNFNIKKPGQSAVKTCCLSWSGLVKVAPLQVSSDLNSSLMMNRTV